MVFISEDINRGKIRYKLTKKASDLQDMFHFDLMDRKPNVVADNIFHIRWSEISFETSAVNVTETAGMIQVPVIRKGNLKQVKKLITTFPPFNSSENSLRRR